LPYPFSGVASSAVTTLHNNLRPLFPRERAKRSGKQLDQRNLQLGQQRRAEHVVPFS